MKHISKKEEPTEFSDWKTRNPETRREICSYISNNDHEGLWSFFPSNKPNKPEPGVFYYSKQELKEYLTKEQGYICCYCNCEIEDCSKSNIEHLIVKSQNIDSTLAYENLVLSCKKSNTCNLKRGDRLLLISPTDPLIESIFIYQLNGEIRANNNNSEYTSEAITEMIGILNLNDQGLQNDRKKAIEGKLYDNDELLPDESLKELASHICEFNDDRLSPFCNAIFSCINLHFK